MIDFVELQKIELNILKEFANFCEKNNLRYYLAYGTLIGAIRHNGFIPWDNDIDVVMPRPDYELFIKLVKDNGLNGYLSLLDYRYTDTFPFAKLVDNRTLLKEHFLVTGDDMGIYIDIFPLDGMPSEKKQYEALFRKAFFLYKLYAMANFRYGTGANAFKRTIKKMVYPISKLLSNRKICDKINNLGKKYEYDLSENIGMIVWGFDAREVMPRKLFEEYIYVKFENEEFRVPKYYDDILRRWYGDYMVLPPEEDRVVHQFEAYWK